MTKNPLIDAYLKVGCGRCPLGGTPECKVHDWSKELVLLRNILLKSGLTEQLKWKVPCYTLDDRNVVLLTALKDHASINFFKGALLKDPHGILTKPGENCQSTRVIRFTSASEVKRLTPIIKATIQEAIEVERAGSKVDFKAKHELVLPAELESTLDQLPALRAAWDKLTPGRQRGYVLYFNAAKQSQTRTSRIEKVTPAILEGRGMHD